MEPKSEVNSKKFVVHSDENREWLFNGKDSVKLYFYQRESFETRNTIHWRGITFHVRIFAPEIQTMTKYVYYYIIYNERIYGIKLARHYAGGGTRGDKPPFIETDKYYLEIYCGFYYFELTEKIKPEGHKYSDITEKNDPIENSEISEKNDLLENSDKSEMNKPVKLSEVLKTFFSRKESSGQKDSNLTESKQTDQVKKEFIMHVCPFTILKASDEIVFVYTEKGEESIEIRTKQVTLYEFSNGYVNINNFAYFDNNDLVVDYWKLGMNYEDEDSIIVKERFVPLVFKEFKITSENKSELLIGILNAFNGKGCLEKFEEFLKSKNIPFGFEVRHDDEIGG